METKYVPSSETCFVCASLSLSFLISTTFVQILMINYLGSNHPDNEYAERFLCPQPQQIHQCFAVTILRQDAWISLYLYFSSSIPLLLCHSPVLFCARALYLSTSLLLCLPLLSFYLLLFHSLTEMTARSWIATLNAYQSTKDAPFGQTIPSHSCEHMRLRNIAG